MATCSALSGGPGTSTLTAIATALLLISVCAPGSVALTTISDWVTGFSTFYGGAPDGMDPHSPSYGTNVGSCGFRELEKGQWPYWSVAALATSNQFFLAGPQQGCGMCFEVECLESGPLGDKPGSCQEDPTKRAIVVQITDQCPECGPNHVDIQALTWAKIAKPSPSRGRINIRYRRVECAPPSNLIVALTANRGGDGWIQLSITKAGGRAAVKLVEARNNGGAWRALNNVWGASWELASAPPPPLDIRVTDDKDNTVTAANVIKPGETGLLPTSAQFTIQDPADVQPSGTNVRASNDITSEAGRVPPGAPAVQAFEGPSDAARGGDGSSPSPVADSSSSPFSSPTSPPSSSSSPPASSSSGSSSFSPASSSPGSNSLASPPVSPPSGSSSSPASSSPGSSSPWSASPSPSGSPSPTGSEK